MANRSDPEDCAWLATANAAAIDMDTKKAVKTLEFMARV